ncbi:MAG: TetR/AcrR family transcriptional regulator [Deltaproteobacteria bacterium]|nr:TetR/AcrR family transcriptional regulator [Deltaproteobacteria bacterium]
MMPPKSTRTPQRQDRREQILAAALASFVERGFYGTAIPQIAEAAGIAAGTIYHYFDSKEALVNTLYRTCKAQVAQRVFTKFPHAANAREQFRAMWLEIFAYAMEAPTAFVFIELHNHASYLDDESRAVDRSVREFAEQMIVRAQGQGLLKPLGPKMLMELVFGAFVGTMRAHLERRIVLDDAAIRDAEQACWDAVATPAGR